MSTTDKDRESTNVDTCMTEHDATKAVTSTTSRRRIPDLSTDIVYTILCFMICDPFRISSLASTLGLVCKAWKQQVERRLLHFNTCTLKDTIHRYDQMMKCLSRIDLHYNCHLDEDQVDLLRYFQNKYVQLCRATYPPPLNSTSCLQIVELAELNGEVFWKRDELRKAYYQEVCHHLQLPPDKNTLHPRPPSTWDPKRTYILSKMDNSQCVVIRLDSHIMEVFPLHDFVNAYTPECIHTYMSARVGGVIWRGPYPNSSHFKNTDFGQDRTLKSIHDGLSDGFISLPPDYAIVTYVFLLHK